MEENFAEQRLAICKNCGLYKESAMGGVCNPNLYISKEDQTTISNTPKQGFVKGCGCIISRSVNLPFKRCVCGKW